MKLTNQISPQHEDRYLIVIMHISVNDMSLYITIVTTDNNTTGSPAVVNMVVLLSW